MDLLVDTHIFLWWVEGGQRLRPVIFQAVRDPRNRVFVSAASIWEISIKRRAGKLRFVGSANEAVAHNGFTALHVTASEAELAGDLDWNHRDPFDRMIIAQCIAGNFTLVTADKEMRKRGEIAHLWAE